MSWNWVAPIRRASMPIRVEVRDLVWFRVASFDQIVVETHWDARLPVFRRSRAAFRQLLTRGARVLIRVACSGDAVARAWQQAHPQLTGIGFWRRYLGLHEHEAAEMSDGAAMLPKTDI
jgi:hypothetical protein